MDLENLFNLASLFNDAQNIEKLDLTKKEDFDKYNQMLDELKDITSKNPFFGALINDEFIDNAKELGKQLHASKDKEPIEDKEPEVVFPSAKIENIDIKMQIHRLTQEYIDTMMKPYMEKGENTTNNINNAYTALFEFACWIYSHK
jgi:hypothetical protein